MLINAVAPFAGAWIEIILFELLMQDDESLPSRERGLKYSLAHSFHGGHTVAPFAGAWIEIDIAFTDCVILSSRSLRGSVD